MTSSGTIPRPTLTLGVLALLISIGIGQAATADDFATRRLPEDLKTTTDSAELSELSMIAQLLDTSWWSLNLQTARFKKTFLARVSDHQKNHPKEWEHAYSGLSWARDSAACHGTCWEPDAEVRWPFFIRFGIPTSWWVTQYESTVSGRFDTVLTFFYWWSRADTGLACQADPDQSFARYVLVAQQRLGSEIRLPIYPIVDIVSFPNGDSTEDVWVTVGISGQELTPITIDSKTLGLVWAIKDQHGSTVIRERLGHKLGLAGLILSVTGNRGDIRIPIHLSAPQMRPGRYEIELDVRGYRTNRGKMTIDFVLPSPLASQGMSDLLLVYTRGPRGIDLAPGIGRNGENLYAVTDPAYLVGDTIFPYAEIAFPDSGEWAYTVTVYLRRAKTPRGTIVRTGQPVVVADSAEAPIARWAGIDIRKTLTVLGIDEPSRAPGISLLSARVYRGRGPHGVFESAFLVTPGITVGEYWLTIEVEGADTQGRRLWRAAQKKIAIVRPGRFRWP
jgi:hypothetical protein